MELSFARPIYLLFLFLIPLIFFIHLKTLTVKKKRALRFANFEAIARIKGIDFFSKNIVILFLSVFLIFLLTMSVSGLTVHMKLDASSFSFVLAVDSSRSMEADDMFPNRLHVAKNVAENFVNNIPISTRVGVVSFSGSSIIEQGMTDEKEMIVSAIRGISLESFGGTDIYETIITSTNLLRNDESRSIILLSDGQINVGKIEDAIDYANENDVIVNAIGIGTGDGGKTSYGLSKLDEKLLKSLSYNTGGTFFKVGSKEELEVSFDKIMKITKRKVSINLSNYLIFFAIILFFIEYVLANTKYKSFP